MKKQLKANIFIVEVFVWTMERRQVTAPHMAIRKKTASLSHTEWRGTRTPCCKYAGCWLHVRWDGGLYFKRDVGRVWLTPLNGSFPGGRMKIVLFRYYLCLSVGLFFPWLRRGYNPQLALTDRIQLKIQTSQKPSHLNCTVEKIQLTFCYKTHWFEWRSRTKAWKLTQSLFSLQSFFF